MQFDRENLFSDDQAVTVTAVSTDIIDLAGVAGADMGPGEAVDLLAQVTVAFVGGTSVALKLETDDDVAFGSATDLGSTPAIATAALVAGYRFPKQLPKEAIERYVRLTYTVVGTMSAGKILAGLTLDRDTP